MPVAIPVAEYVRMSTEDQKYSIPSQQAAIRQYAAEHGFVIARTYADPGRSGLLLRYRTGLSTLLRDVLSGTAGYKAILVYDVSRWGRFQNPDEAAHYDFICANAGIPVHYCAEQFSNDGTVQSTLMKAIKRTMAAEFSRELGCKVFDGVRRLILDGFHGGGVAPYGLARLLISASGIKKGVLNRGEAKNLKTDRVVLVRGKRNEVQNVQRIFTLCAHENLSTHQIAEELNASGSTCHGKAWNVDRVSRILRSRRYLGLNVWGKRSIKLQGSNVRMPLSSWVISKARFKPIIDRSTFEQAQRALAARHTHYNRTELLSKLQRLRARRGRLSVDIINRSNATPHTSTYQKHFGSLLKAYELAGFAPLSSRSRSAEHAKSNRALYHNVLETLEGLFPAEVRIVRNKGEQKNIVEVDRQLKVSVFLCGQSSRQTRNRNCSWLLRVSPQEKENLALICTLDWRWKNIVGYYLLRPLRDSVQSHHWFTAHDPLLTSGQRLTSLTQFCCAVRRLAS